MDNLDQLISITNGVNAMTIPKSKKLFAAKVVAASVLSLCASAVYAGAPMLVNPTCTNKLVPPPNGNVGAVYVDEECITAYVAPPVVGSSTLTQFARNSNLGFCPAVDSLSAAADSLAAALIPITDRINAELLNVPDKTVLTQLNSALGVAQAPYTVAVGALAKAQDNNDILFADWATATAGYRACLKAASLDPLTDCSALLADYTLARAAYVADVKVLGVAQTEVNRTYLPYLLAKHARDAEQTRIDDINAPLIALVAKYTSLQNQITGMYGVYAQMQGGVAAITYTTDWTGDLNKYVNANTNSGLTFRQLPIKSVKFSGSIAGHGTASQLPAVLAASVPGFLQYGAKFSSTPVMPDGSATVPTTTSEASYVANVLTPWADSISGQLTLSLVGSCELVKHPDAIQPAGYSSTGNKLGAYIALNLQWEAEGKVRGGYDAFYNLSKMVDRIETKKTDEGFFSSKSLHELTIDASGSDSFVITWDAQAEAAIPKDDQFVLDIMIKTRLYANVLDAIGTRVPLDANAPPVPEQLPPLAGVYGSRLRSQCFWGANYACYGGWVLTGLNALFGGNSTATSHFKQTNTATVHEKLQNVFFVPITSALTYK